MTTVLLKVKKERPDGILSSQIKKVIRDNYVMISLSAAAL